MIDLETVLGMLGTRWANSPQMGQQFIGGQDEYTQDPVTR